jgi:mannosyl-3-phosphoglycerate phosphatase
MSGQRHISADETILIIFTDLDGTLLDARYSFKRALPALNLVAAKNIPLIVCSSKTRAEIEVCRKKLNNEHPFIAENGGGVFIPTEYFKTGVRGQVGIDSSRGSGVRGLPEDNYTIIKLGAAYTDLRNALQELRAEGFDVSGFGDMSVKEISELTGLKTADAKRSKQREFDEPFVFRGSAFDEEKMQQSIRAKGLRYTQGEFYHIMGDSDKGRAVDILKDLYAKEHGKVVSAALGDSPNDIEMLQNVDYPFVVQKRDGSYNAEVIKKVTHCVRADGTGPEGWNRAVTELLEKLLD